MMTSLPGTPTPVCRSTLITFGHRPVAPLYKATPKTYVASSGNSWFDLSEVISPLGQMNTQ